MLSQIKSHQQTEILIATKYFIEI